MIDGLDYIFINFKVLLLEASMSITTRDGDNGQTGLIGPGRVSKADLRIQVTGEIDELVANLGVARAFNKSKSEVFTLLKTLQSQLFNIGSSLASPDSKCKIHALLTENQLLPSLENLRSRYQLNKGEYDWAIPGDRVDVAFLEVARTVCRRVERTAVALKDTGEYVSPLVIQYLNRLSDLLWLLGRWIERGGV